MFNHVTVLLNEAVEGLNVKPDGIYVDCTLGGAGHSSLILKQLTTGHLYCFDQDIHAIEAARERLEKIGNQFTIIQSNFKNLKSELHLRGVEHVDGILFDLGVSSPQFDDGARGFSYNYDARLDMRMNQEASLDAHYIVNHYSYEQLVEILYKYADEKFAKQIARKIEKEREVHPIDTTFQLSQHASGGVAPHHPTVRLYRVFSGLHGHSYYADNLQFHHKATKHPLQNRHSLPRPDWTSHTHPKNIFLTIEYTWQPMGPLFSLHSEKISPA